ncbi:MAG: flagellar hook-length control protein FliK [Gallionella sp.]|nr:flagellar hook-length control protein FliK [Gallionella sp.]
MTTLTPNLLTTPPAQTGAKTTANNSKPDDAPEQAFGSVLARQLDAEQPASDTAATLKAAKKALTGELTKDSKDALTTTPVTSNDPAANLIAMLQAPIELRTASSLAAQDDVAKTDSKTPALGLVDKLAIKSDKAELLTSSKSVVNATDDKFHNATSVAQQQAAIDPAKAIDAKTVILTDTVAAAPRAQDVAAFTAPTLSAVPPSAQTAPSAPVTVATPMGSSVWADDFAQQVTWMATGKQEQTASLHLNPPDLGPMQVVVKVSDSQATILFTSPHGAVREAIENAMPKLREMMADNGITLGNTSVSDQAPRERNDANENGAAPRGTWSSNDGVDSTVRTSSVQSSNVRHKGMVDTFA